jgi:hypothetical protein
MMLFVLSIICAYEQAMPEKRKAAAGLSFASAKTTSMDTRFVNDFQTDH